jgi:AraC-like DNA-binding protein
MLEERTLILAGPGAATTAATGLPRIERIAWSRAGDASYRREGRHRVLRQAAIQITLAGRGTLTTTDGAPQRICRGQALLFIAGEDPVAYGLDPADAQAGTPWEFLYANLDGDAALRTVRTIIAAHGHVVPFPADCPSVRDLLAMLPAMDASASADLPPRRRARGVRWVESIRTLPPADNLRLAADVLATLLAGLPGDGHGAEATLAGQAMAWLRARLDAPASVAACARHVGVSREHLTRVFIRHAGLPPAAWLRRERLRHAETLLSVPTLPVATVARRCGFAGASHFIHAFRSQTGTTPERWRRGN